MSKPTAEFDIVVWGATGFTGRLVAEYLAKTQDTHRARWALAGRDLGKLEKVRQGLTAIAPAFSELPLLVADARDAASLDALVPRTRVVCTTVGPYARYGSELVAACVRAGVSYCDLTGEVQWMRRMIDAHHEAAQKTGARIVHTCGFDSIPSDLGVLMMQHHMREAHGGHLDGVRLYMGPMRGGASGGTAASMLQAMEDASTDRQVRKTMAHPHGLDPVPGPWRPESRDAFGVHYSQEVGQWTGPFFMASVNTRVVRRSNALLGHPWGEGFRYAEVASYGTGPKGLLTATGVTVGILGGFVAAAQVKPLRKLLETKVLPAPGEGPSAEAREKGFFVARLMGEGTSAKTGKQVRVKGKVAAQGDPGYAATARMLSESALSLAFDDVPKKGGGVLTPASCMGMKLVERLRRAGMTFEVETLPA